MRRRAGIRAGRPDKRPEHGRRRRWLRGRATPRAKPPQEIRHGPGPRALHAPMLHERAFRRPILRRPPLRENRHAPCRFLFRGAGLEAIGGMSDSSTPPPPSRPPPPGGDLPARLYRAVVKILKRM